MAPPRVTVVISQAPGKNPVKRQLEEQIAMTLMLGGEANVSLIPNLYDLPKDHSGLLFLRQTGGDIILLSWLYPRAVHWTLDRQGIPGKVGRTLLPSEDDGEELEADDVPEADEPRPKSSKAIRSIYALDLRSHSDPEIYLAEIRRIIGELATPVVSLGLGSWPAAKSAASPPPAPRPSLVDTIEQAILPAVIGEELPVKRRWYPVIDYDRCTNCMECIDFCLFGVYGVDSLDNILVEQQDNCKKGCPACSRVCPANAIIFPEHKTPAIAGAEGDAAGFKIDLSKLFGGDDAGDSLETAVKERDAELLADGRTAVGMTVGVPKRQANPPTAPRDDLDNLLDALDNF